MQYTYTVHYEICDNILENIQANDDMHEVDIESFLREDRRAKLAIVRQLEKDGHIRRVNAQSDPFRISITVEGRQFWIDGGYKKLFEELREKHKLETELLRTNIKTNNSTKRSNTIQIVVAITVAIFVVLSTVYQVKMYNLEERKVEDKKDEQYKLYIKTIDDRLRKIESDTGAKNKDTTK